MLFWTPHFSFWTPHFGWDSTLKIDPTGNWSTACSWLSALLRHAVGRSHRLLNVMAITSWCCWMGDAVISLRRTADLLPKRRILLQYDLYSGVIYNLENFVPLDNTHHSHAHLSLAVLGHNCVYNSRDFVVCIWKSFHTGSPFFQYPKISRTYPKTPGSWYVFGCFFQSWAQFCSKNYTLLLHIYLQNAIKIRITNRNYLKLLLDGLQTAKEIQVLPQGYQVQAEKWKKLLYTISKAFQGLE